MEVRVVRRAHERRARGGELENDESGPRLQYTSHLTQSRFQPGEVAGTEVDDGTSNARITERKAECIGNER